MLVQSRGMPDRVGGELDPFDHAVLVGVDLLEPAHHELPADVVGQQTLGLRSIGRSGEHELFLLADLAVVVLIELVGFEQLHVDEVVDRQHALAPTRLDLLVLGRRSP